MSMKYELSKYCRKVFNMFRINEQMLPFLTEKAKKIIWNLRNSFSMDEDLAIEITHLVLPEDEMYDLEEYESGYEGD